MKIVIISGYFNPIHKGHIEYIKRAKELGDWLVVIVNNDLQVKLKGSQPFMDESERVLIVKEIKGVDDVFLSIDKDKTVCESIKSVCDDLIICDVVFAKGGDRTLDNIPEKKTCEELGIKMIFGVGGGKTQSSSELLRKVK
jgi:cytidyltransferase-like protein